MRATEVRKGTPHLEEERNHLEGILRTWSCSAKRPWRKKERFKAGCEDLRDEGRVDNRPLPNQRIPISTKGHAPG